MSGNRVAGLNEIIHQSTRLRIMSALAALEPAAKIDFSSLGRMLNLTDGNLGAHIGKLEQPGYVRVEKTFIDRKPRTFLILTTRGRSAFEDHVEALKNILGERGE